MWKPTLSAAYQVRFVLMPPKARVATLPSSLRLQGQPQCSSRVSSFGASSTKYSMTSWSPRKSDPLTVSYPCISRLSSSRATAAAPPSAETVWLRIG
jgi:hypothetical protein